MTNSKYLFEANGDDPISIGVAARAVAIFLIVLEEGKKYNVSPEDGPRITADIINKMGVKRLINIEIISFDGFILKEEYDEIIRKEIISYMENKNKIPSSKDIISHWTLPIKVTLSDTPPKTKNFLSRFLKKDSDINSEIQLYAQPNNDFEKVIPNSNTIEFETIKVGFWGSIVERKKKTAEQISFPLSSRLNLDFIKVPAGSFMMGSNNCESEKPIHHVSLSTFWMTKYPITQKVYEMVMGSNPSKLPIDNLRNEGDNHPVNTVNWNDAMIFCFKLQRQFGHRFSLPSESQWEYACRAGTTTKFYFGDFLNKNLASYDGRGTMPVGQFPPNDFGLYDMHGNVFEWCLDTSRLNYVGAPSNGSAWSDWVYDTPSEYDLMQINGLQICRGGSGLTDAKSCRSATRYGFNRTNFNWGWIGFRVCCIL
jgi:formylglycine-generating enzyme required for sulfatase activity